MFEKGYVPWNKGMNGYTNSGSFKKGQPSLKGMLGKKASLETRKKQSEGIKKNLPSTVWKKGHIPMSQTNPEIMPKGKNHHKWIGGRVKTVNGYIWCWCPSHPEANHNYVYEHRLMMEEYLQRELFKGETVHHINKIKSDNRLENFILFISSSAHHRFHKEPNNVKPEEIIFDGRKYQITIPVLLSQV